MCMLSHTLPAVIQNCQHSVSTKTRVFSIHQGVFQGDTLSPLLFNVAINPLLAYLSTSEYCGYSAQLQAANNSIVLPPLEAPTYVSWSDSSDDSLTGLYRANVTFYHGSRDLVYDNGDTEQSVDLHTVEWCYVGRYFKVYRSDKPFTQPSASTNAAALPTVRFAIFINAYRAKGFADDLTVISKDTKSHQQVLSSLVLKAMDICFEFQPQKCISLNFNGYRMISSTVFSMADGNTINICNVDCTQVSGSHYRCFSKYCSKDCFCQHETTNLAVLTMHQ